MAVSRKKDILKAICQNNTEENKRRYKRMKIKMRGSLNSSDS